MEPTLSPAGYAALTILLLPLAAAMVIALYPRRDPERSANLSIGAIAVGFVLSLGLFFFAADKVQETNFNWLSVGELHVSFGLLLDPLSKLMLLVVTGVGLMIHIYSRGYLHGDRSYSRYFASLSLFTFSMLGIVLANNLFMMFVFWELVGVSSYLLIGFWFEKNSAADAAKKAFLTNRVGDFGFILGIILTWLALGSVNFAELAATLDGKAFPFASLVEPLNRLVGSANWWAVHPNVLATLVGLLLFMGAMGKSAQFPLHVWLPDAMEGPTPVSALIHAATMVAAGVFMLCRIFFLLDIPGSHALEFIAWIGGFTALLAAVMALQQNDIKRILAYSSINHLGYCLLGVFAAASATGTALDRTAALNGVVLQMFNHGITASLLFCFVAFLEDRSNGARGLDDFGGLRKVAPVFCGLMGIALFSSLGLPGLNGFIGEFLIFKGVFPLVPWAAVLALPGLLVTAIFILTVIQKVWCGPLNEKWVGFTDLTYNEGAVVFPATLLMFVLGVWPQFVIAIINPTVAHWVRQMPF